LFGIGTDHQLQVEDENQFYDFGGFFKFFDFYSISFLSKISRSSGKSIQFNEPKQANEVL
jgi:hypothetical protein